MFKETRELYIGNKEWDLWSYAVFGNEADSLLSLTGTDATSSARTRTEVHDSGAVKVWIAEKDARDPFIFTHELAHGYHSLMFSEATRTCVQSQAEAAALMCEDRLCKTLYYLQPAYQIRSRWIHQLIGGGNSTLGAALNVMREIEVTNPGYETAPLYELVQAIINGAYGDGYAEVSKTTH